LVPERKLHAVEETDRGVRDRGVRSRAVEAGGSLFELARV
jgi:hypothetical protein